MSRLDTQLLKLAQFVELQFVNVAGPAEQVQHNVLDFLPVQFELGRLDALLKHITGDQVPDSFLDVHGLLNQGPEFGQFGAKLLPVVLHLFGGVDFGGADQLAQDGFNDGGILTCVQIF